MSSPLQVFLEPGETIELRGAINGDNTVQIIPRPSDCLPKGIRILTAMIIQAKTPVVKVLLHNSSRNCVKVDNSVVLAELHSNGSSVLEALVGPSCEAEVQIENISAKCLVDSGSQVSIVSESFHRKHLGHLELNELDVPLRVTGAGGQSVPYKGYITAKVTLPSDIVGVQKEVEGWFLVCQDTEYSTTVPMIIGTNTIQLYTEHCRELAGRNFATTLPMRKEIAFIFNDQSQDEKGKLGSIKLRDSETVVPAGEMVELKGVSKAFVPSTRDSVIVQEPTESVLPDGLEVVGCKVPTHCLPRLKVMIRNTTDHDIVLKKRQVIADIFTLHSEYDMSNVLKTLGSDECASEETVFLGNVHCQNEPAKGCDSNAFPYKFGEGAPEEWCNRIRTKLKHFDDVFIKSEFDIGSVDAGVDFEIDVTPGPQIKHRARPISPKDFEDLRRHLQGLLDANIITPSNSSFSSPIVLCRKKNFDLRLVCDYRLLNSRTIKDAYAVPKIEDLIMTLSGSKYFCSLDLCKAFYHVPMSEQAKKLSAFITPFGLFEWNRLSQGLVNAPSCFQRIMENVFRDMNLVELIIFLDDLLIHAGTWDELEERTVRVLERLRRFNLKIDPAKCVFGATEIKHLGFVFSEGSVRPDPDKVSAIKTWPKPKTVKDVKSLIGFANVYRRFIPNFSSMVKPLNDLTTGYVPSKGRGSQKKKAGTLSLTSDISDAWKREQDEAFESLKRALSSDLVIGIADKSKPFFLHCDASGYGLGAILYQEFEGKMKVIAYASRGLNKSEQNYPAHKREFLALKWAMTDKFQDYLLGSKITVVTDNNPLCYILKNAKLDATSHRWLASLSMFDFELRYKKGSTHIDADTLSRLSSLPPQEDKEYLDTLEKIGFMVDKARKFDESSDFLSVSQNQLKAVLMSHGVYRSAGSFRHIVHSEDDITDTYVPAAEQLIKDPSLIPDDIVEPDIPSLSVISQSEWRRYQLADKAVGQVLKCLEEKKPLLTSEMTSPELKVFAREQKKLVVREGVLYRKVEDEGGSLHWQLVVPPSHRKEALKGVHEDLFHTHYEDAISQLRMRFFWPYMARDLEKKIKRCGRCIRRGAKCEKAPMKSIVTTFPLELLSIDFLTIEVKGIKQNILVIMDHFTKFSAAICTKDQTARTVAKVLWKDFFMLYGFPKTILSDQGRDFESKLVKELCQLAGIQKIRTTPYHPSGNPVERWNRTLINMLRSLEDDQKTDWRKSLPAVVHAYNSCIHQSTGYSPYFLMFGRHPRLPIDLAFGIDTEQRNRGSTRQYVKQVREQLTSAYDRAKENMQKSSSRNKARYDSSAHAAELEPGDRVLVRKLGPRIDSKISDRWEKGIHVVLSKSTDMPVYTVQEEVGKGPVRTLHRNYLLPIGMLDSEESSVTEVDKSETKKRSTFDKGEATVRKERGGKPKEEMGQGQSGEDWIDDNKIIIEISLPTETDSQSTLRAEAPVFVPETPQFSDQSEQNPETPQLDDQSEQLHQMDNLMEEESEIVASDHETEDSLSEESDSSDSEPSLPEGPRRSGRERKPVDRLNLAHQAEHVKVEDGTLSELVKIQEKLETIVKNQSLVPLEVQMHFALESIHKLCEYMLKMTI